MPGGALARALRLLLVDDEPDIRESLAEGLRLALGEDLRIDLAGTAAEARVLVASGPAYDAALVDEKMPGETGSEFLAWLRERHPGTVRVLMSAYPRSTMDAPFQRAAPALMVKKPFQFQALVGDLRRLLTARP